MVRIIMLFIALLSLCNSWGQGTKTIKLDPATSKSMIKTLPPGEQKVTYLCPKCGYASDKPIQCPKHKIDLLREGSYYCKNFDGVFSQKPGKCPKCHQNLVKLVKKPS